MNQSRVLCGHISSSEAQSFFSQQQDYFHSKSRHQPPDMHVNNGDTHHHYYTTPPCQDPAHRHSDKPDSMPYEKGGAPTYMPWRTAGKEARAHHMAWVRSQAEATRAAAKPQVWVRGRNENEEATRTAEEKRDECDCGADWCSHTSTSSTDNSSAPIRTPSTSTCSLRQSSSHTSTTTGSANEDEGGSSGVTTGTAEWWTIFVIYGIVQLTMSHFIVLSKHIQLLDALMIWLWSGFCGVVLCLLACVNSGFERPGLLASCLLMFQEAALIVITVLFWDCLTARRLHA